MLERLRFDLVVHCEQLWSIEPTAKGAQWREIVASNSRYSVIVAHTVTVTPHCGHLLLQNTILAPCNELLASVASNMTLEQTMWLTI